MEVTTDITNTTNTAGTKKTKVDSEIFGLILGFGFGIAAIFGAIDANKKINNKTNTPVDDFNYTFFIIAAVLFNITGVISLYVLISNLRKN